MLFSFFYQDYLTPFFLGFAFLFLFSSVFSFYLTLFDFCVFVCLFVSFVFIAHLCARFCVFSPARAFLSRFAFLFLRLFVYLRASFAAFLCVSSRARFRLPYRHAFAYCCARCCCARCALCRARFCISGQKHLFSFLLRRCAVAFYLYQFWFCVLSRARSFFHSRALLLRAPHAARTRIKRIVRFESTFSFLLYVRTPRTCVRAQDYVCCTRARIARFAAAFAAPPRRWLPFAFAFLPF